MAKKWVLSVIIGLVFCFNLKVDAEREEPFSTEWELTNEDNAVIPGITIISPRHLVNPTLNGLLLAKEMLTGSVITIDADGKGTYSYSNNLAGEDIIERPKFFLDARTKDIDLGLNEETHPYQLWQGELIYKFQSAFPFTSFQLSSLNGAKVSGGLPAAYCSNDGKSWKPMQPPRVPPELFGKATIYIKLVSKSKVRLFTLYVSGTFSTNGAKLPLLQKGSNKLTYKDDPSSSHKAIVLIETPHKSWRFTTDDKRGIDRSGFVVMKDDYLGINFPNGMFVEMEKKGGYLLGIGRIIFNGLPLRNALYPPLMPLVRRIKGKETEIVNYEYCKYLSHEISGEKVIIHSILKEKDNDNKDRLDWVFSPKRVEIDGHDYTGFSYYCRFESKKNNFSHMVDPGNWEIGGSAIGNRILVQRWDRFMDGVLDWQTEMRVGDKQRYFGSLQPFSHQVNGKGSLITFYEKPTAIRGVVDKPYLLDCMNWGTLVYFGKSKGIESPVRTVLFSPREGLEDKWQAINEWTRVFDFLGDMYRARYGLRTETEWLPTFEWGSAYIGSYFDKARETGELQPYYYEMAKRFSKVAKLGIKTVALMIWESDCQHNVDMKATTGSWLKLSQVVGGEAGVKYFTDRAHELGMKMETWTPGAHMSRFSDLFKEHPEWAVRHLDGSLNTQGHSYLVLGDLWSSHFDYLVDFYKKVHDCGLDILWLDSFQASIQAVNYAREKPAPHFDRLMELVKRLQDIGYLRIIPETIGPFGVAGIGYPWPSIKDIVGREYGTYRMQLHPIHPFWPEATSLCNYKAMANKGVADCYNTLGGVRTDIPGQPSETAPKFSQAYHDYNKVYRLMEKRYLLAENGVAWKNKRNEDIVLFSFQPFEFKLKKRVRIVDVTEAREFLPQKDSFLTKEMHTYWIKYSSDTLGLTGLSWEDIPTQTADASLLPNWAYVRNLFREALIDGEEIPDKAPLTDNPNLFASCFESKDYYLILGNRLDTSSGRVELKIRGIKQKIINPLIVDVVTRKIEPIQLTKKEGSYILSLDKQAFALFLPIRGCKPIVDLGDIHTLSVGKSKKIELSLIGAKKASLKIKAPGLILNDDLSTLQGKTKLITIPGTLKVTVPEGGNWGMYRVLILLGEESRPKVYSRSKAFAIPDFTKPDEDISAQLRPREGSVEYTEDISAQLLRYEKKESPKKKPTPPEQPYQETNPVVIADDGQASFWTKTGVSGGGSVGVPVLSDDSTLKTKGNNSLKIEIPSGAVVSPWFAHSYDSPQDWSGNEVVSFYWHGANTGKTGYITLMGPTSSDYKRYGIVDDFSGWKRLVIPLNNADVSEGNFDISQVIYIEVQIYDVEANNVWRLDRIILDTIADIDK